MLPGLENVPKNLAQWREKPRKVVPPQAIYLKQVKSSGPASYLTAFDPVDVSINTPLSAIHPALLPTQTLLRALTITHT